MPAILAAKEISHLHHNSEITLFHAIRAANNASFTARFPFVQDCSPPVPSNPQLSKARTVVSKGNSRVRVGKTSAWCIQHLYNEHVARVAELADAPDLGSGG
jgi:hypothetical protein